MQASASSVSRVRQRLSDSSEVVVLISFAAIFLFFALRADHFLSLLSITNILTLASVKGIFVVGVAMLMISGEFDLSVGSILAVAAFVFAITLEGGLPAVPAMLLALAGLHALCAGSVRGVGGRADETRADPGLSGLRIIARSPYLQHMGLLAVLVAIVGALLDYAFKAEAKAGSKRVLFTAKVCNRGGVMEGNAKVEFYFSGEKEPNCEAKGADRQETIEGPFYGGPSHCKLEPPPPI